MNKSYTPYVIIWLGLADNWCPQKKLALYLQVLEELFIKQRQMTKFHKKFSGYILPKSAILDVSTSLAKVESWIIYNIGFK